ncbi:MAG: hypothetical protein H7A25_08970 [Leptospiraceae bacterium]|nr:hypothetical protein [Leptospiraceae bacterium]
MFSKLKQFFYRNHIENLTIYIVIVTAFISGYCYIYRPDLGLLNSSILQTGQWQHLFVYPFRIESSFLGNPWLGLFFYLYIYAFLGNIIEGDLGAGNYNLFIIIGFLSCILGAFASLFVPLGITSNYIYLSVFLAVAYRFPQIEIYLFFLIPVKLKWLGILSLALLLLNTTMTMYAYHSAYPLLGVLLGLSNVLIFYGYDIWKDVQLIYHRQKNARPYISPSIHRCTVCGKTEKDDPLMEFRYCVDCSDHEYCLTHLKDHKHIKD